MSHYILIPAYKPEQSMLTFTEELLKATDKIIVVDDGGGEPFIPIFDKIRQMGVTVLVHPVNKGKGAALKTGISYIIQSFPDCTGIITADCDGQHTVKDILKVSESLEQNPDCFIIGGRALKENVPLRSRFGNSVMRNIYRLASGFKVRDTQTGLRGIPKCLFERSLDIKGDRYEYEMNMLLYLKDWNIKPIEVRIDTIYINNNEGSHFNTFKDSSRIMKQIFKYLFLKLFHFIKFIASSLICFLVEYFCLYPLFLYLLPDFSTTVSIGTIFTATISSIFLANVFARILSSIMNYILNRKAVFGNKGKNSLIKYYGLVLAVMILSSLAISGLSSLIMFLGEDYNRAASIAKPIIDAIFFVMNFFIQKHFIFNKASEDNK